MLNQDYAAIIAELTQRVVTLEAQLAEIKNPTLLEIQDWDNATLMREWNICERTAANYRKQGLQFYKRGGRVFYTTEARKAFLERNNNN